MHRFLSCKGRDFIGIESNMTNNAQTIYLSEYQAPDFYIHQVDLEFDLYEEFTQVNAKLQIETNPNQKQATADLILYGRDLELISIHLDDQRLDNARYSLTDQQLTIRNVPKQFQLAIKTKIKPQENTALSGLYKSSGNFCTQCEAEGFRRITYFIDRPDVMARYTTTIIADKKQYPILLSNGNLIEQQQLPNGRHKVTWQDPFKKPSYLFALVAGDLEFIEDFFETQSGRRVTLRLYVEKGNLDKCSHAMNSVKKAMRWDEEKYGREYDLDIYMIVAVSDFNMGAMENKGLNIFNTQYVLANGKTATDSDYVHVELVIGHEYFHNWTGNRITCRDWFQLSLKEGLTVFREQCFTADMTSKTVARINDVNDLRNSQFIEDAGPLAHPVRPESYIEINNFYTATVYSKGAEVIRMQRTILGDKLFRQGMDLYFARYDGQAVTIDDFVKAMEDASHIDLTQFRLWYSQAGTPVLDIQDHYNVSEKTYTLKIKQSCPPTPGQKDKKPFYIPIKFGLLNPSGEEILRDTLLLKEREQEFKFEQIAERPIPSILREFSAPVKVNYEYSDTELQFLFKHDTDLFNRWEAGQKYALNLILRLIKDFRNNKTLQVPVEFVETFKHLMHTMQDDKLLLAEMLTLPSEKYISEQMPIIDVDAIHWVREFLSTEIAHQLKSQFLELFYQNNDLTKPYQYQMQDVAKRQLTGRCLLYLSMLDDADIHQNIIMRQFKTAFTHNMTDTMAALRCIVNSNLPGKEQALSEFYNQWQTDALVVDKWFVLQATSKLPDTLTQVKRLAKHAAFDIKNPNKVYSLIGSFGHRNPVRFHAISGEGYEFLTENVLQLNALNPQIAARMVKPFSDWKRFDVTRQQLMRKQLERILNHQAISKDVSELVSKSLQY